MSAAGLLKKTAIVVLLAGVSVSGLTACAGKSKQEHLVYEERPVELLYNTGMQNLDQKNWADAVLYFQEVQRQHPYSEWSRRAIVMTIYADYQADKYDDASDAADQFIKLYPGSDLTPYAYYMKAICQFEQIVDVGRDQGFTLNAQALLTDVIRRYPDSEYAKDARVKLDMVHDQLAGKEMAIGRWYLNDNQPLAAIGRFKAVVENYQTTSHVPEALYRLVEANEMLGLDEEAKRDGAVLGYNYPGDRWYAAAYKLLTDKGTKPDVKPDPKGKKGPKAPDVTKKKSWLGFMRPKV
ncbi:outer membrane protein assembly factor BamD [Asticcacaulis sp. EMRT-3]|uniref:outer membrane protein assembly factor BamD n=1 Tax=Asticcacaulis sp. EMRT-3 TaxID=3040349 RepID=UPI0024AF5960|nr:outer membrane protein assembly factor BamD [Asticcacaulis sp. EMRT-3]MDI7775273.1 outer membrane protein assembly factor BamD [Asticcacaulis sp. EMRT-3]